MQEQWLIYLSGHHLSFRIRNPIYNNEILTYLFYCSNDDGNGLEIQPLGSWELIEVLADPGDGSGTIEPVESNKTMDFSANGIVTTNSSLCDPYSDEVSKVHQHPSRTQSYL